MPALPPSNIIILFPSTSSPTPSPLPEPSSRETFGFIMFLGGMVSVLIAILVTIAFSRNIARFFKHVVFLVRAFFRESKRLFKALANPRARVRHRRQEHLEQDQHRMLLQSQALAILERYYKACDADKLEQTVSGEDDGRGAGSSSNESSTIAPTRSPSTSQAPTPHTSSDCDISAPFQHQRSASMTSSRSTSPALSIAIPCPAHIKETRVQMEEEVYRPCAGATHCRESFAREEEEEAVYHTAVPGSVHLRDNLVQREEDSDEHHIPFAGTNVEESWYPKLSPVRGRVLSSTSASSESSESSLPPASHPIPFAFAYLHPRSSTVNTKIARQHRLARLPRSTTSRTPHCHA